MFPVESELEVEFCLREVADGLEARRRFPKKGFKSKPIEFGQPSQPAGSTNLPRNPSPDSWPTTNKQKKATGNHVGS